MSTYLSPKDLEAEGVSIPNSDNPLEVAIAAEGVNPKVASVARSIYAQESNSGKNTKTSNAGAMGGMQITPATFKQYADKGMDINNPVHNAQVGVRILNDLHDKTGGNPKLMRIGYYGGQNGINKANNGQAVSDPRNPNAPNTFEYADQSAAKEPKRQYLSDEQINSEGVNPPTQQPQQPKPDWQGSAGQISKQGNPYLNAVRGLGGQIINNVSNAVDLLPGDPVNAQFRDTQWRNENHPGSGVGQFAGDMATFAPAGGFATVPARIAANAVTGAATSEDGNRMLSGLLSGAFSGLGEGAVKTFGSMVTPFKKMLSPTEQQLVTKAQGLKIPLDAADVTGNKTLKYADSVLDTIPSSSVGQQEFKQNQSNLWHQKLFEVGGHRYDPAANNLDLMQSRLSNAYDTLSSRNNLVVTPALKADILAIKQAHLSRVPTNQRPVVKSYIDDFLKPPVGAWISGSTYQDARSMLGKKAKSLMTNDASTAMALNDIKKTIDFHMFSGLSPADKATWLKTNHDYAIMKTIGKAYDSTHNTVSPLKLSNAVNKADPNRTLNPALANVADVGRQFIAETLPQSGTAPRAALTKLLTGQNMTTAMMGSVGGLSGALSNPQDPISSGLIGAGIGAGSKAALSHFLPKIASNLIQNPNGYLVNGLVKPSTVNILSKLLGNTGAAIGKQVAQ